MSLRTRNPFKLRASEKIESDTTFLRIYSPVILEDLAEKHKEEMLWNDVVFLRSSPGAGKSSLLRIFEPATLVALFNSKSNPNLKDLRDYLRKIEVMDNNRINLLGVCLHCNRNYEILEDLPIDDTKKRRFFFALINARVVMASLRGILNLKSLPFPSDLEQISIDYPHAPSDLADLSFPCSGKALYEWAENIEKKVYKALDSFLPIEQVQPQGHTELFTFSLITKSTITVNGEKVAERVLFMFDDTHKLSIKQHDFLVKYIVEQRKNYSIWIAERFEALTNRENLKSSFERDYNEMNLEAIWQKKEGKFKNIVTNIANRRAAVSTEDVPEFDQNLTDDLNEAVFKDNFIEAFQTIMLRLEHIQKHTIKFNEWIEYLKSADISHLERANLARATEIVAHKNLGQQQMELEMELSVKELHASINSSIQNAAEYFNANEFKLPYYYGFDRILQLSSYNIDQFLQFASELYEGMLSNRIARKANAITAEEQHKIIKRVVNEKWIELGRLIPYSEQVKRFLQKFHEYALKETNRPTIPYAPGVTGFALKEPTDLKLIEEEFWLDDDIYVPLVNVLSTCISFNLIEKREVAHGKKGSDPTTVFYLNRWLCVRFNLPFGYGGWRSLRPAELLKWIK